MKMELVLRFDYGSIVPWVRRVESGLRGTAGPDTVYLWTDVRDPRRRSQVVADFTVKEGQRIPFTLTWSQTHRHAPKHQDSEKELAEATRWWHEWSERCTYRGPWWDAVVRSLITLKALMYAADRRDRRRADDFPARRKSAACETGITATAGCAMRRSRCTHCSSAATRRRPRRGANG